MTKKLLGTWLSLLAALLITVPSSVSAGVERLLVIGVIASGDANGGGVALIRNQRNSKTFAARVGQEIDAGVVIRRITREHVYFTVRGETIKLKVGEDSSSAIAETKATPSRNGPILPEGLGRQGNVVTMTQAYRDQIVKNDLSKILMQAAAVPAYANGKLMGFRMLDIEPGSIFELSGLINGDVITSINGHVLSDVGQTIKLLQTLKQETKVDIGVQRGGQTQTLSVVVD